MVSYRHAERVEAFILFFESEGNFVCSRWYGPDLWRVVVDRRKPGEYSDRSERSLAGTAQRRPVGVSEVRNHLVRTTMGADVGYADLLKRIKNPSWMETT